MHGAGVGYNNDLIIYLSDQTGVLYSQSRLAIWEKLSCKQVVCFAKSSFCTKVYTKHDIEILCN